MSEKSRLEREEATARAGLLLMIAVVLILSCIHGIASAGPARGVGADRLEWILPGFLEPRPQLPSVLPALDATDRVEPVRDERRRVLSRSSASLALRPLSAERVPTGDGSRQRA